jgi:hypothetical protein
LFCQIFKKYLKYAEIEYTYMLLCLGAADNDASEAAREYARARLYLNRRHPDAKVIKRVA